jgi:TRAP-type C4-dicarboxylate transport system substrate-binding protein
MGDERDMVRKMHISQIHAAMLSSASLGSLFSDVDVLQIPFLFNNYPEADFVVGKMEEGFKRGLEKNGYVALGWTEAGFVYLMSTVPVDSLEQIRKAKVWVWSDSPMAKAIFSEAGSSACRCPSPTCWSAPNRAGGSGLCAALGRHRPAVVHPHHVPHERAPELHAGGLVVKKEAFDKISPDHQAVIKEVFQRHMMRLKEVIRAENQEALNVMQNRASRSSPRARLRSPSSRPFRKMPCRRKAATSIRPKSRRKPFPG